MAAVPITSFTPDKRGDTLSFDFTVSGVDLTASTTQCWATGVLVKGTPVNQAVFQKTKANGGIVVTSATTGTFTLQPTDTSPLPDGSVIFGDVQTKTPATGVKTQLEYTLPIEIDVTQETT